jgi:hypothetical protein
MSKKIILVLMAVVFLSSARLAFASLIINEIMYAPANGSDYEWVEIFNNGSNAIDLDNYRFFHGENNSGPLTLRNGNTTVLQPSGYAIITKSLSDYTWLNSSLMILSASTLSLPDTGTNTYIAVSDPNKVILDHVTYDTTLGGTKESGNSLQLINGSWIAAMPTPGAVNQAGTTVSTAAISSGGGLVSTNSDTNSSVVTATTSSKIKIAEESKIKTQIKSKTTGFVGLPLAMEGMAFGLSSEPLHFGKYFWNFGDGDSKEVQVAGSGQFTHTYFYPGDYTVTLDYYSTNYEETPDASTQTTIKIVPADISISKVGDEKDFFVELTNNTDYSADISNWFLTSDQKSFMIPRNTILASKGKMMISPKITGFTIADQNTLKLVMPSGEVVFEYVNSVVPAKITTPPSAPLLINPVGDSTESGLEDPSPPLRGGVPAISKGGGNSQEINSNATLASAVSSDIVPEKSSSPIIPIFSVIFIGASASGVYFIRRKKIVPVEGNDFEILDE